MTKKIKDFAKKHYYLLTGILWFLSVPSFDVWFLKAFPFFAWIAYVPLFVYVRDKGYREVFRASFMAGLLGNLLAYQWIGAFGAKVPGGYFVVLLFLIPSLTVFFVSGMMMAEFLSRRVERLRAPIYAGSFVVVYWVQSMGYLAYPMNYWGYSQFPFTPFIQVSSIVGIMGVCFILIFFNESMAGLIARIASGARSFREAIASFEGKAFVGALALVAGITAWGAVTLAANPATGKRDLRALMVQSCISPWENWEQNKFRYLDRLTHYTNAALASPADKPDLVVWSESATLEKISYFAQGGHPMLFTESEREFIRSVFAYVKSIGRPLLTGEIGIVEDLRYRRYFAQNSAVLIGSEGNFIKAYPKINLVPFGEWFPYHKWLPIIQELTFAFGGSNFVPGDRPVLFETGGRKFGVLICYEGIFFRLCRDYKRLGADFLVNITNDGWTDSFAGHMQHFASSVFRSVENGIWYVRAGNTGLTMAIDPYGRMKTTLPILEKGTVSADLDFSMNRTTVYARIGDVFLYLVVAFIAAVGAFALNAWRRERRG
ncbi:MAG TPA: apolipoprotein N-acyltransferase [Spirochaetota bacterium]|nr:apolipoprotein N-acyltransferase [Spirochaetota bacterium]HNT11580.1 apolipoprotein N-acyltransferase [Spirochaetota bacterium]